MIGMEYFVVGKVVALVVAWVVVDSVVVALVVVVSDFLVFLNQIFACRFYQR